MAFGSKQKQQRDYDPTNRGALFENDRKRGPKSPDFKGSLNVDGRDYWLSGWEEKTRKGDDYLKLSVQRKDENRRDDYESNGRRDEGSRGAEPYDRGADEPPFPGDQDYDRR